MAQVTTGDASNARPPEGKYPLFILATKHAPGKFGTQLELTGRLTLPDGERMNVKRWISYPPDGGKLPTDHVLSTLAAAALYGKTELAKGESFDDEDPRFVGTTVMATIRHFESGPRSSKPGTPSWAFKTFEPHVALIPVEEAEGLKAMLKTLFAAEYAAGPEAFKTAVNELMVDAINATKLVAELTKDEAVQVKAAIKAMAKVKKVNLDAASTGPVPGNAAPVPGNAAPVPGNAAPVPGNAAPAQVGP